jgi:citrate/tricarballylate utilization protein
MVSLFLPIFAFAVLALGLGVARFWRQVSPGDAPLSSKPAVAEAAHHALKLKHLDGGHGEGCHNEDDAWTHARRRSRTRSGSCGSRSARGPATPTAT